MSDDRAANVSEGVLILEEALSLPPPLDPYVANLAIEPLTNSPTEGFNLAVSASYGSDYIEITSDDSSFEAYVELYRCGIEFEYHNCYARKLTIQDALKEGWEVEEVHVTRSSEESEATSAFMISPSLGAQISESLPSVKAALDASARKKRGKTQQVEKVVNQKRTMVSFRVLSNTHIEVGYPPKYDQLFAGSLIDNAILFKIIPIDSSKRSGLIARCIVRENWINLSNIKSKSISSNLSRNIEKLLKSDDTYRRVMFEKLLRHLVIMGLQDENEVRDATIAADAIVLRPSLDEPFNMVPKFSKGAIRVKSDALSLLLNSPPGQEISVLLKLGVPSSAIDQAKKELQLHRKDHDERKVKIRIKLITDEVAKYFSLRKTDLKGPRRAQAVAKPRQMAMLLCKVFTDKSNAEIGREFGGRDHTTVIQAVKRAQILREKDPDFEFDMQRLIEILSCLEQDR